MDNTLEVLDTFGKRLSFWRKKRGFRYQNEFSELVGLSQGSLSSLEKGEVLDPRCTVLLKAAKVLGLNPYYLYYGHIDANSKEFEMSLSELDPIDTKHLLYIANRLRVKVPLD
jgi:transcriptional regulator with XRE-family HTH domain